MQGTKHGLVSLAHATSGDLLENTRTPTVLPRRFLPGFLLAAVLPFVALGLFMLVNLFAHPENGFRMLQMLPFHVIPFGSETTASILVFQGVPLTVIVAFLLISDLATSLPFIAIANGSRQVPLLGRWVAGMENRGAAFYNKHAWVRRLGPYGIAGFVALPLAGTGSTVGVLLGRASGFPTLVIASCVAAGALVRWIILVSAFAGVSLLF